LINYRGMYFKHAKAYSLTRKRSFLSRLFRICMIGCFLVVALSPILVVNQYRLLADFNRETGFSQASGSASKNLIANTKAFPVEALLVSEDKTNPFTLLLLAFHERTACNNTWLYPLFCIYAQSSEAVRPTGPSPRTCHPALACLTPLRC
jgi:hypothetical protein